MKTKAIIGLAIAVAAVLAILWGLPGDVPSSHDHGNVSATESGEETTYYTCPMHTSVRSDKPGACPVCGMALVKRTMRSEVEPHGAPEPGAVTLSSEQRVKANIAVVPVRRSMISRDISAVGLVSYAEPSYRRITMRFPGRLDKLYLSYTGQAVRKGDPVADVYSPEAISAQQEYLLALDAYERAVSGGRQFAASAADILEQSKQKLLFWGFAENQIERLKETRQVNSLVTILSEVSGTVVRKSVDPQQYVATGGELFDVADLATVWVLLDVYEKDLRFVGNGQRVEVKTDAFPLEAFVGRVVFVDPVLNPETRTVRVRSEFSNQLGKLRPNMYVKASIRIPKSNALIVPSTAVLSTGRRTVVWVESKQNQFTPRDVVVGVTSEGATEILNGLREGEMVAETGGFLIDSESALQQPTSADPHAGHTMNEER